VNDRDGGRLQRGNRGKNPLPKIDDSREGAHAGCGKFLEIRARQEHGGLGAVEDHAAHGGVVLQLPDRVFQFSERRQIKDVGRRIGVIEGQGDDAVVVVGTMQIRQGACVSEVEPLTPRTTGEDSITGFMGMEWLESFEKGGTALSTSDAHGDQSTAPLGSLQLSGGGEQETRPTGTDRMPEGDGAAVRIEASRIDRQSGGSEGLTRSEHLSSERFVDLDHIGIPRLHPGGLGEPLQGDGWAEPHPAGITTRKREIDEPGHRIQAEPGGAFLGHHEQGDRAVRDLRGIPGGHRSGFTIENGRKLVKRGETLFGADAIVAIDGDAVPVNRNNFTRQKASGGGRAEMRRQGKLVLKIPADAELPGENLCGLPHVESGHGIGQPQLQRDHRSKIRRTKPQSRPEARAARLRPLQGREFTGRGRLEEERNPAHAFRAADHEHVPMTSRRAIRYGGERFQSGAAIALHRHRRNMDRNAGTQGDDAGDIGGIERLRNAANDHFTDLRRIDRVAREELRDRDAAQFNRFGMSQGGAHPGEGRTDAINED